MLSSTGRGPLAKVSLPAGYLGVMPDFGHPNRSGCDGMSTRMAVSLVALPDITVLAPLAKPGAKSFVRLINTLANKNGANAGISFEDAKEEILLQLHAACKDENNEVLPAVEDGIRAARDLEAEYERTRDNRTRETLNRALLGRFNSKR